MNSIHRIVLAISRCRPLVLLLALAHTADCFPVENIDKTAPNAKWIWSTADPHPGQTALFRQSFDINDRIASARLQVLNDFCDADVYLNAANPLHVPDFGPTIDIDVTQRLVQGKNVIGVRCRGTHGPTALAMRLIVRLHDGSESIIVTNGDWLVTEIERPGWNDGASEISVDSHGWSRSVSSGPVSWEELDDAPISIDISELDDYTQWMRALSSDPNAEPAAYRLAPGFTIELVHAARPEEGSWVSLEFDSRGRPIIAREDRGLLRMSLSEDGRRVESVESIEDTLQECRGLLWAYDGLYVHANNSKGLYRLRDSNGDDRFDEIKLLHTSGGDVGHGRNDLALGPDGLIYAIHGDSVETPENVPDRTSPFCEHRRHPKLNIGHVWRIDRDGHSLQVVATGLRNPYGVDFNSNGEMFTYDADAEFDMGAPWYRPTRVDHIVSGADFGWRAVTGSWPPYFPDHPDNSPPGLDIGKGSPTAVKFGTKSNFPPRYRNALFILDWAYGRIIAVHFTPRGASYRCRAETVVKGRPLNVTDLGFGPDGSMYVVTGGRKTRAGLYRITYVGSPASESNASEHDVARADHAKRAQASRRQLEQFHGRVDPLAVDAAWQYQTSADPWLRYAARIAIEHQPLPTWRERAFGETDPTALLTAMAAVVRSGDRAAVDRVLDRMTKLTLADLTPTQQQATLYVYQLCLSQLGSLSPARSAAVSAQLHTIFPSRLPEQNRSLAAFLTTIDPSGTLVKVVELLRTAEGPTDRLHYLFVLRNVRSNWKLADRNTYFATLQDLSEHQGGEGLPGFLKKIREEAVASLTDAERMSLATLLDSPRASSPDEPAIVSRPFVRKWTVADLSGSIEHPSKHNPDLNRGRAMFDAASCSRCHRVGQHGTLVGPDLTFVSSRFGRRDILESIISPSRVVADNYRSVRVVTTDGIILTGRVLPSGDYRSSTLRLATDPNLPQKYIETEKNRIETSEVLPTSWMPEGLLDTLTEVEILDLVAYIEGGDGPLIR